MVPPKEYDTYLNDLQSRLRFIWEKATENIDKAKLAPKHNQDKNMNILELREGDWTLWKNPKPILSKMDVP